MKKVIFQDWNNIAYSEALKMQESLFNSLIEKKITYQNNKDNPNENFCGYIIFCEHPHVITLGKYGKIENLLMNETTLKSMGVDFFRTTRGGDITYHGPGQIVGYPILDLEKLGLTIKRYVYLIEQSIIDTLKFYNLDSMRVEGATGVWIETINKSLVKICAIGIRVSHFVSMHGFAFNVNTDLKYFKLINPCGFTDKGVTSLEEMLKKKIDINETKQVVLENILKNLSLELT